MYYSLIIKTTSSVHFNTVDANLIDQTTSSNELVVLKRRIIVVIRKDSRCWLLHQLEQHRRILLSKETYRTLAQPADSCGNPFGDMIWKIPNPTLSSNEFHPVCEITWMTPILLVKRRKFPSLWNFLRFPAFKKSPATSVIQCSPLMFSRQSYHSRLFYFDCGLMKSEEGEWH